MEPNPKPTTCWSNIVKQPPPPSQQRNGHPAASAADGIFFGNCKSTKGIAVAVVDANALIQGGEKLHNRADKFVSVSEVIDEIRQQKDVYSRQCFQFLSNYIWIYSGYGPLRMGIRREIDEALRPGVYALIDACSADDLQHIHTVFGARGKHD